MTDELKARITELERQLENERIRLSACGAAALGYFEGCKDEYKSASLDDVLRLRERADSLERQQAVLVEALTEYMAAYNEHWERGMPILEPMGDSALAAVKGDSDDKN